MCSRCDVEAEFLRLSSNCFSRMPLLLISPAFAQYLLLLKIHASAGYWSALATAIRGETIMAMQIVMDGTGDSRHSFDPNDSQEVAKAERRFYELTNLGFTAAARTGPGQVSQIRSFDPSAEETVLFPRLVGGCSGRA